MFNDIQIIQDQRSAAPKQGGGQARQVYFDLLSDRPGDSALQSSRRYLREQLQAADRLACDLPADIDALTQWIDDGVDRVGQQYRDYLQARKAGGARRYFSNKAHALYFLNASATT